jgi:hypothetical protein
MIRQGKTEEEEEEEKGNTTHVPLHLSQCLETEPGPSREEIGD